MEQNLTALKQAAIIFPILAVLFTLPYLIYNYRKYGSVLSLRIVIVYSFMLYMLCVYCLVILPLPTGEAAARLRGHKMQLIPLKFIPSMAKEANFTPSQPSSWAALLRTSAFLTMILNVLMTLPFGIYLRYYFRCGWKKTLILGFLLSLFFELTQLSGLYFIYPGTYRLFDVDDLITNTLGAMIGWWLARPLTGWLPDRDELDSASFALGKHVSSLRRLLALGCDLFIGACLSVLTSIFLPWRWASWSILLYFCISPIFGQGQTVGLKWMRIQIAREDGAPPQWYQYAIRYTTLFAVMIWLPVHLNMAVALALTPFEPMTKLTVLGVLNGGYLFALLFEVIRLGMHKPLFYERFSGTRLISLIPVPAEA